MTERQLQSGYIEHMEKPYIFTYDGELLQLVPQDKDSIKPYDFLINKNTHMEILEGTTIQNDKIYFLSCELKANSSGYVAKPAGYVYFDNDNRSFETITFKGGIIDFFYRPNHIIDEQNTKYNYNDGGGEIKLKPFDDISKECEIDIDGKKAKLLLSVTLPSEPTYMVTDYTLGKPKSILRLQFEEKIDVTEFRKMYMWLYNFMSFVCFNKSISLGKINLGRINEDKKIEEIAYVYLNEKGKEEIEDVDKIIGYFFVWDKLNELMYIVNREELNLLIIPQNKKNNKYLTSEKYSFCQDQFNAEIKNFSRILYARLYIEEIDDIDQEFAKKRNSLMHSSLGEFEDVHIISYNIARAFIYIMILKKAGIESNLVIQGIEKILL